MNDSTAPTHSGMAVPQFQDAITAGKLRFTRIKDRYPELKGYLVLSSPTGQTKADNDLLEMVGEFPNLFLDGTGKTEAQNLVRELRLTEKQKDHAEPAQRPKLQMRVEALKGRFQDIAPNLVVNGSCHLEIRFHVLDYALIWRMQTDELVDRDLTPQTRASIRIVLGTLSRIAGLAP